MKFDRKLKEELYRYSGYIYRNGAKYTEVKWYTTANSDREAFRNFLYKAKKAGGDDIAEVNMQLIRSDEKEDTTKDLEIDDEHDELEYCDVCGTRLTDGGYCPKCDEYPDYMDEKLILENDKKPIDKTKNDLYNIDMMKKENKKKKPTPISESTGVKHDNMKSLAKEVKKLYPKTLEILGR